jgi:hypothetical protein
MLDLVGVQEVSGIEVALNQHEITHISMGRGMRIMN